MNIKKYLFFAVLTLLLFSTPGSAEDWEITFEDHPYDSYAPVTIGVGGVLTYYDNTTQVYISSTVWQFLNVYNTPEFYFNAYKSSTDGYHNIVFYDESGSFMGEIMGFVPPSHSLNNYARYHLTIQGNSVMIWCNGSFVKSYQLSNSNDIYRISIAVLDPSIYFDDFSTSPYCIGHKGYVTPSDLTIYFTINTPIIDGYSYYVQMCDPNGAEVKRWNEISFRNTCSYTPALDMTVDGLYYLYIYGQDDKLYYSKPFLYTSGEILGDMVFQETGTANVDVRNSANQGGEIESGGSRYLYFDQDENGNYPVTVSLLENAYSFTHEHNLVYAMYGANSSLVTFNDLQSSYYITLDGEAFPATAATGNFTFTGNLSDGDTLNISTDCYEFDNEGNLSNGTISVPLNITNLPITTNNLLAEIEANGTTNITANLSNGTLSLLANTTGATGNLISISANAVNITASGPYLTGGTDPSYTNGATSWSYNITDWTTTEHIFEFTPDYTKPGVYGYVKDADTQNPLRTTTVTISDIDGSNSSILWTDSNGLYYKTTGMVAGKNYLVKAAKTGYTTSEVTVTITEGATTQKDFYLSLEDGAGLYYSPHYVQFIVESFLGGSVYPDVNVTVYTDSTHETEFGSKITDDRGVVGWEMKPDIVYYFTLISPEQGINKEISICPGVETIIHIPILAGSSYDAPNTVYDDLSWVIYKNHVNLSSGFINVSVDQTTSKTVTTNITITNMSDTVLYTQNYTTTPLNYSVLVPTDQSYIVYATISHPDHEPVKLQQSVTWNMGINSNFNLGWEEQWQYSLLATITMILVLMLFPSTIAHIGGIVGCGVGAFHIFVTGWLPNDTISIMFAFLAIMLAYMFNARKQEPLK